VPVASEPRAQHQGQCSTKIGGDVSVSITEDADLASGLRLSGFLLSIALVLSRAVAWRLALGIGDGS